MKKIIGLICMVLILVGCTTDLADTPTKQVEAYLNKFQTLDNDVMSDLNSTINNETGFTNDQRNTFRDIMRDSYQQMTYTIKEERIDGNTATVTVEIVVIDFATVLNEAELYRDENMAEFNMADEYDEVSFIDFRLQRMKEQRETVTYTIDFTLTRSNNNWVLDNPTNEMRDKINGIFPR